MRIQPAVGLGLFTALLALSGCDSNSLAEVKGTVKYDGKLIDKGSISFYPVNKEIGTAGGEIKDGQYFVKVPVGPQKVTISWPKVVGKKKVYDTPDSPERLLYDQAIPAKYADMNNTELTLDVKPGLNQKDWDLPK
jgi:hypothetical protein